MTSITDQVTYVKERPILSGLFAVLAVIVVSAGLAFVTGIATPPAAEALIGPPCCAPPPPPPSPVPVCDLSANPTSLPYGGGSSTLTWSTTNATDVSINHGVGNVADDGSQSVNVTDDITYTLTASGPGGQVTCNAHIDVGPPPNPDAPVCTLVATPATLPVGGGTVTLAWTTQNAASATIDQGVGSVSPVSGGQTTTTTNASKTYTMTATGPGGTVTCSDAVVVPPPTPDLACTLDATPTTLPIGGGTVTLNWTTQNAATASIDQGVGTVSPTAGGSVQAQTSTSKTYTLTAIGSGGQTVTCSRAVTVPPPTPQLACVLTASPHQVAPGGSSTLTWTTQNATSFSINQGIGPVTPVPGGSVSTGAINSNTTFTGTATGANGQTITCSDAVTVSTEPPAPLCEISLNKSSIVVGESAVVTWNTTNVVTAIINQGIGNVAVDGSQTVSPTQNTTYTLTGTSANGTTVTCSAPIVVTNTPPAPSCVMSVNPTSISSGGSATLSWGGTNISSVVIDQGIGSVGASGSQTVSPSGDTTYTGTFTATNGQILTCTASLDIESGGGGGGGSKKKPKVLLDVLPHPPEQPLSFVYLSELPYTGLELGPMGTALYWLMLIGWSVAAGYLILFNAVPFALRRVRTFGTDVQEVLNKEHVETTVTHTTHQPVHTPAPRAPEPVGYNPHEGFRSFATGGALTIDDIVNGLARETEVRMKTNDMHVFQDHNVEPVIVPNTDRIEMSAPAPVAPAMDVHHDVPAFITALLNGDRDTVFGMLRHVNRTGGDSDTFVTHAVCALDDAYRARLEGTACHPEVARATEGCETSFLERVIASLATAVDSSYSSGVTGAKLALTRALAVVNG